MRVIQWGEHEPPPSGESKPNHSHYPGMRASGRLSHTADLKVNMAFTPTRGAAIRADPLGHVRVKTQSNSSHFVNSFSMAVSYIYMYIYIYRSTANLPAKFDSDLFEWACSSYAC